MWALVSSGAGVGGARESLRGCVGVDRARVACPVCILVVFSLEFSDFSFSLVFYFIFFQK